MLTLFWLLIPVAAASGWYISRRFGTQCPQDTHGAVPGDYIRGLNYLLNEQPDKALEVFVRIVDVDPATVETHLLLGNLFRRRGEVERAIRVHESLIRRPELSQEVRTQARLELGRDYLRAGLLDRAEDLFLGLLDAGVHRAPAYRHLMEVYEKEKDWDKAIRIAQRLQDEADVSCGLALAHYYCELAERESRAGRAERARALTEKALRADASCARASILLGDLAWVQGDANTARMHYERVYEQDPDFVCLVLSRLRDVYAALGEPMSYSTYLERIQPCGCESEAARALAESALESGDEDGAESVLRQALRRSRGATGLLRETVQWMAEGRIRSNPALLTAVADGLADQLNEQAGYQCRICGFESHGMFWQCPGCRGWGTVRPAGRNVVRARVHPRYRLDRPEHPPTPPCHPGGVADRNVAKFLRH